MIPRNRSGSIRFTVVLVALSALLLLAGCGDKKSSKASTTAPPKLSSDITLTVESNGFDKKEISAKPGTIKITVLVPEKAKGKHGVGIDGGDYKNIKGAPVAPGRSTSLTVAVKKGDYTVFDSYKNNREKGFESALSVK